MGHRGFGNSKNYNLHKEINKIKLLFLICIVIYNFLINGSLFTLMMAMYICTVKTCSCFYMHDKVMYKL